MRISQLLEELGEIQGKCGDIEVCVEWVNTFTEEKSVSPIDEVECNTHTIWSRLDTGQTRTEQRVILK